MSNRRRCRECSKCLITNRNWSISAKDKKDYICKLCSRNKHNKLYLQQREDRIKKTTDYYKKGRENGAYKYGTKKWASMTLSSHRYRDRKKKFLGVCDISADKLLEFIKRPCEYCGCINDKITLDRVDCNKGHTLDNVVPCCGLCNTARMAQFTYEEMKILGKSIAKIRKRRG